MYLFKNVYMRCYFSMLKKSSIFSIKNIISIHKFCNHIRLFEFCNVYRVTTPVDHPVVNHLSEKHENQGF